MKKLILNALNVLTLSLILVSASFAASNTISNMAALNPNFSTLLIAWQETDLVKVLDSQGPFTVFAPSNAAFAKLPSNTINDLLKPENKAKLSKLLQYHIVPSEILAANIKDGASNFKTLEGQDIVLNKTITGATVNNIPVVSAGITASNGTIYVIDSVLMPPAQ
jgi:uncharacterized surface protein with fasciclin (FAS1) repeats